MGYRPDDQALVEPIEVILQGMKDFDDAVDKRNESGDWQEEHLKEINDLSVELKRLKFSLVKIKQETW